MTGRSRIAPFLFRDRRSERPAMRGITGGALSGKRSAEALDAVGRKLVLAIYHPAFRTRDVSMVAQTPVEVVEVHPAAIIGSYFDNVACAIPGHSLLAASGAPESAAGQKQAGGGHREQYGKEYAGGRQARPKAVSPRFSPVWAFSNMICWNHAHAWRCPRTANKSAHQLYQPECLKPPKQL